MSSVQILPIIFKRVYNLKFISQSLYASDTGKLQVVCYNVISKHHSHTAGLWNMQYENICNTKSTF